MLLKLTVQSGRPVEVINVTDQLRQLIAGISDGLVLLYLPHTTACLLINEDDDELRADFVKVAENWLAALKPFKHLKNDNPNTQAHVLSAFGGNQVSVAIVGGALDLGKYQNILLLEMDGPKQREIRCQIVAG
jgi:secondary thiamine-phosphate synthase enzyme